MPSTRSAPFLVLGALLLAACGSGDATDDAASTTSVESNPTTTQDQPADTQPADTQPADTQPADTQPADTQPADTQPADTQPADTQPDTDTDQSVAEPVEIAHVVAAVELAGETVSGEPFAVEFDDDRDAWEVSLAVDGLEATVWVTFDGTAVIEEERDDDGDDDIDLLQSAEIGAIEALQIIAPAFTGRFDDMEIDTRGADIVWEIEIHAADRTRFNIIVDALSGDILDSDDGRPGSTASAAELDGFIEYETILQEIPEVADLAAIVETDNPNSRVIVFGVVDGPKSYRSVFIKRDNRLKLVGLDANGLIFDDTIT